MSWKVFKEGDPRFAEYGAERFSSGVAYLATSRKDGSPRVHPVTPIIAPENLFIFMEPTSPKGDDLRRDGRYAMHASVEDPSGGGGEFLLFGEATPVQSQEMRQVAVEHASYRPADRYILFELSVKSAFGTTYTEDGTPVRFRWRSE